MGLEMLNKACGPVRAAPAFLEVTGATLLIGRLISFGGRGEELLARWDRWSAVLADPDRCAVPAHDLSCFEEYVGFEGRFRVAIGIHVATSHADEGPSRPFDLAAVDRAAARARAALDDRALDRIAAALGSRDAWSLRTQRTRALLVPFGPIASARLAFGTLARAADPIPPGAARVRGTDMRQRRHELAVDGELVASASDWDVAEPVLRAPARDGAFHVVARYG